MKKGGCERLHPALLALKMGERPETMKYEWPLEAGNVIHLTASKKLGVLAQLTSYSVRL